MSKPQFTASIIKWQLNISALLCELHGTNKKNVLVTNTKRLSLCFHYSLRKIKYYVAIIYQKIFTKILQGLSTKAYYHTKTLICVVITHSRSRIV